MNSRDLNALVAEYERATRPHLPLFEGLTIDLLNEMEELADSDVPSAMTAERLGVLAVWQDQLRTLGAALQDVPALRPYLTAERTAWRTAYARTTAAFTGWFFDGWTPQPDSDDTAGETDR
ncbi:hypothetical protein ACKI1O_41190 [Streptomyces scabiei]